MNNKLNTGILMVIGAAVIALFALVFLKDDKVAYIDSAKLIAESNDMKALKTKLEKDKKIIQANVDTLTKEFENELKKYEKTRAGLSKKEIQLSEELLRNKQQQVMQYQKAIQQKTQEEEQKQYNEVLQRINGYIMLYGEKNGYKIIFATSQGNIAYADKGLDITDKIIEGVNGKK